MSVLSGEMLYLGHMDVEGGMGMISVDTVRLELAGRFNEVVAQVEKYHLSVRWEPAPRIVRVGACIDPYNWDTRMSALDALLDFELAHADEFAVEFDIIPLVAVNDEAFAEA